MAMGSRVCVCGNRFALLVALSFIVPSYGPAYSSPHLHHSSTGTTGQIDHACPDPDFFVGSAQTDTYDFEGDYESHFYDHPAWGSHEAALVQLDGSARVSATGTGISETWKTWREQLPYNKSWKIAVDVAVPESWESVEPNGQIGASLGEYPRS